MSLKIIKFKDILKLLVNYGRFYLKHKDSGFIVVSAQRHEYSNGLNRQRTLRLKNDISRSGYIFVPVIGGYQLTSEDGTKAKFKVAEHSFLIINHKKGNTLPEKSLTNLYNLGMLLLKKYEQESIFVKYMGKSNKAECIDINHNAIYGTFSEMRTADNKTTFFTTFLKLKQMPLLLFNTTPTLQSKRKDISKLDATKSEKERIIINKSFEFYDPDAIVDEL